MGSVKKAAEVIKRRTSMGVGTGPLLEEEVDTIKKNEDDEMRATIMDDALHVLDDHQDALKKLVAEEAEIEFQKKKAEEERLRLMMNIEGRMEKKSHNVWQKRHFILSTRYNDGM